MNDEIYEEMRLRIEELERQVDRVTGDSIQAIDARNEAWKRIEELKRALAQVHGHINEDPRYQGTVQIINRVLGEGQPNAADPRFPDTPEGNRRAFIAYLLAHLPDDGRENETLMELRAVLEGSGRAQRSREGRDD